MSLLGLQVFYMMAVPGSAKFYLVETGPPKRKGGDYADTGYSSSKAKDLEKIISQINTGTVKPFKKLGLPEGGDETMSQQELIKSTIEEDMTCGYPTWLSCNGKCQTEAELCNGTCHTSLWKDLGGEEFKVHYECKGKCVTYHEPCEGRCRENKKPCADMCIDPDEPRYECNGKCLWHGRSCNGTCSGGPLPVSCGSKCISEEESKTWQTCGKRCIPIDAPCDGKCHASRPKPCGKRKCLAADDNKYQMVGTNCAPSYAKCGDRCPAHAPFQCQAKCYYSGSWGIYDNRIMTCSGSILNLKQGECQDVCVDEQMKNDLFQDCDGKCILQTEFCASNCKKGKGCNVYQKQPLPYVDGPFHFPFKHFYEEGENVRVKKANEKNGGKKEKTPSPSRDEGGEEAKNPNSVDSKSGKKTANNGDAAGKGGKKTANNGYAAGKSGKESGKTCAKEVGDTIDGKTAKNVAKNTKKG